MALSSWMAYLYAMAHPTASPARADRVWLSRRLAFWTLQRTETIDSRQPQERQIMCGIEVRMSTMTTMETGKLIALTVSSVPFLTHEAVLRGLPGIFSFQTNTLFLTQVSQALGQKVVQPMRQPSIQAPGKRSSEKLFHMLQVFDTQNPDIAPVDALQGIPHQALDVRMSVFLVLRKALKV